MPNRILAPAECLADIADESGIAWETLWNHARNAALRSRRPNPNVLLAGDEIFVPDKRSKEESSQTNLKHYFRVRGVPVKLIFRLLTLDAEPRAEVRCKVDVDGALEELLTDDDGRLELNIPPHAALAKVSVLDEAGEEEEYHEFDLARLNPVTEVSGLKARLRNLGFYEGSLDGALDDAVREALMRFQASAGLSASGDADAATQAALLDRHGS